MNRHIGYYLDRYSAQSDAIIFGLFFSVGLITQLVLRLWLDVSAVIVTVILLLLMSVYAALIQVNSATKTGSDRSGDTLYFLGFIFTTITLGIALFKIGGSDRDFATSIVLYDLGIGIATTIWGLVLRVIFSLMRTGTEEIETRTLSSLNQRSKSLSAKLTRATQIAEETTLVVQQVLDETQSALKKIASSTDERFSQVYDDTIENHRSLLEQNTMAMRNLYERIDKVEVPTDIFSRKLESVFGSLDKSLASLESRISGISIPPNLIESKVDAALRPMTVTLDGTDNALSNFRDRMTSLSEINFDSITVASDGLRKLGTDINRLREELSGQSINTANFDKFIDESGEKYLKAVEGLAEKISAMTLPTGHLQELIDNSFEKYHLLVADTSRAIVDDTAKLKVEISELKSSLGDLSSQVSVTAEELKKSRASGNFFDVFRR